MLTTHCQLVFGVAFTNTSLFPDLVFRYRAAIFSKQLDHLYLLALGAPAFRLVITAIDDVWL